MKPPYEITNRILKLITSISERIGEVKSARLIKPPTELRKKDRIEIFKEIIGNQEFSRQDYLRQNKDLSSATASRDLKNAVDNGILIKSGDKRLTKYRFV